MTDEYLNMLIDSTDQCKAVVAGVQQDDEFCFLIFNVIRAWAEAHRMDPVRVTEEVLRLAKFPGSSANK